MNKTNALFLLCLLLVTASAHAQGGCVQSPECPTAILAVVGAAGAAMYNRFKR